MSTLLLVLFITYSASAHDWYDYSCCSDKDCRPIESCDLLQEDKDGSIVYYENGIKYTFDKKSIKPSHDNKCHVCIQETEYTKSGKYPRCVYIQLGT